jgi:arylsulfatase A-like enzyme
MADDIYNQFAIGAIPKYLAVDNITDVDYYISQYDGEISYIDSQIGRLCEELKKLRLDKNTMIIINSDHGEGMGEHNEYFCHSTFLYDELIRIPLIIKYDKHIPSGKKIDIQVRSIDIMPTILDILRIKKDKYLQEYMQGASLLPLIFNPDKSFIFSTIAYSEFLNRKSIRTKEWKLIYNEENGQYELYNLIEDPSETNNLVLKKSKEFSYLKQKLDNYMKSGYKDKVRPEFITREEIKEKLRSLGYLH